MTSISGGLHAEETCSHAMTSISGGLHAEESCSHA